MTPVLGALDRFSVCGSSSKKALCHRPDDRHTAVLLLPVSQRQRVRSPCLCVNVLMLPFLYSGVTEKTAAQLELLLKKVSQPRSPRDH